MINPSDVSIVFCANNGYKWTKLAIDSFKHTNPDYKDSVILFNDNWSLAKYLKNDVSKILTWKNRARPEDMLKRVGEMYQECAEQIDTKYICFIDNDTISFENNWLSNYLNEMIRDNARIYSGVCFNRENIHYDKNEYFKLKNIYAKEMDEDIGKITRLHYFCIILDHEYFKTNWNINGYLGHEEYYSDNGAIDIGTEFYYFCKKNNIKIIEKDADDIGQDALVHVTPNPNNPLSNSFLIEDGVKQLNNAVVYVLFYTLNGTQKAIEVCKEIGFNFTKEYKKILDERDVFPSFVKELNHCLKRKEYNKFLWEQYDEFSKLL